MLARRAFFLPSLIVILAVGAILVGLLMPAIVLARQQANRSASVNNLRQLGLAVHLYHDTHDEMPPNLKDGYSVHARLLEYVEQANVAQAIDYKKPPTDKANAAARKTYIKVFVNPQDPVKTVTDDAAPTNYLWCAGSKPALKDNDGVFAPGVKVTLGDITAENGTSNTLMAGETLKGDGSNKASDIRRQFVALKKDALGNLKPDAGVADFKDGKNVVGSRCASWLDGAFLQTTFTATLPPNADEPDVDCEGYGGLSSLRSRDGRTNILYCDGHISSVAKKIDLKVWKLAANWKNAEAFEAP